MLLLATLAFRKRLLNALGAVVLTSLLRAVGAPTTPLWVEKVSEAADGTETRVRALAGPWKAFLGGIVTGMLAGVKLPKDVGLPPGVDAANLADNLPALIMMMPGKSLNLGGFRVPKELAAAASGFFAPLLKRFSTPKAPEAVTPANPFLKELGP